jgi:predicted alpha-1,2-mannosidase
MRSYFFILGAAAVMLAGACTDFESPSDTRGKMTDLTQYVNPLIGTDSEFALSNGNTYPAIALPWGMNFWTPQTGKMGDGWAYTYRAYKIRGFKQTHQPSPWINDYAAFALMPLTGRLRIHEDERASWFSHKRESAKPHYYQVYLGDHDTWVEITPTERCAHFRFTFPNSQTAYIVLDAFNQGSHVRIDSAQNKVSGFCRNNSGGVPDNFHNYFVARFSLPFDSAFTWKAYTPDRGRLSDSADHVGAALHFRLPEDLSVITVKVASSFISPEQAELNLEREIGEDSFEQTLEKAKNTWNRELNRISVSGGTQAQRINFYTALYRVLLFPRRFHEIDREDKIVHYSPYNGQVLPGYMFTDNGFWDTFRAVFPFFNLMYRELNAQIMEGLVNTYLESGWLPEWASPGHRDCMIGSNSASIIADAYLKGLRGYDIDVLYQAMLKNAENEGPLASVGRRGVAYYNRLGYIPRDVGIHENVARTLEYSYADFAIAQLAKALERPQAEVDTFAKRAAYYRNVFDTTTNFMRGRLLSGEWQSPFIPEKWGDAFTEGSAWHYTWSVFHDPQGLIDLMGGDEAFIAKLDSVFTSAPTFDYSYYGIQIHEITEMLIAGMGQYAHGNQPIQHGVYLYAHAGAPWKTQARVREIMDILYTPTPDGLCGDEDNGQTSAWYVFSALGFYPVCPGVDQYVLGSPLFDRATLHLENGKNFTINAAGNGPRKYYIANAILNTARHSSSFITFDDIQRGGRLSLRMSRYPNLERGVSAADRPYSFSRDERF